MSCFVGYQDTRFHNLEYHSSVRRCIPASVAVLALALLPALSPSSHAQINGVPASVTSPGFGGRPINGTSPSVTSLGPRGFAPNTGVQFFSSFPRHDRDSHGRDREHHRRSRDSFPYYGGLYAVPVPVPYAADTQSDANDNDDDPDYQGGPTIFDRRGPGAEGYVPPVQNPRPAHATQSANYDPAPEPPQPPTVLVFKDGRQLQVENYAIVGQTLYDLSSGRPRKIALADLDLDATQKLNDDRGVSFQLPPTTIGN
jgi:hypothetical protein